MNALKKRIEQSSITRNMIYVSLMPLVVAIIFAVLLVLPRVANVSLNSNLAKSTELAVLLSDLLHEQQKERGATAVYLNTGGKSFGPELKKQRIDTNAKRAVLLDMLPEYLAEARKRKRRHFRGTVQRHQSDCPSDRNKHH